jgi:hypothetical protein
MVEFTVYHEKDVVSANPQWVAYTNVRQGYIDTHDTQKEAIKSAKAEAQAYADRHDVTARIEVYQKNRAFKKTIRVEPA